MRNQMKIAVALSGVLGLGAVATATGAVDLSPRAVPLNSSSDITSAPAPAPIANTQRLVAFAKAREATDKIPEALVTKEVKVRGGDLAASRRVFAKGNASVFAVPVKSGVCLSDDTGVVNMCLPDDVVASDSGDDALRGIQTVICSDKLKADELAIFGLLPKGIKNLTWQFSDGHQAPASTSDSLVYETFSKSAPLPLTASWTDASGATHVHDTPIPKNPADQDCIA